MCGVLERIYSIFFSGSLSSTQFVSVTELQFFYIDSSIAGNMVWFNVQISLIF